MRNRVPASALFMGSDEHRPVPRRVCTGCGGLRSETPCRFEYSDRCSCQREHADGSEPTEREAAIPCTLCVACGLETVDGHTKWRNVVCPRCQPTVMELNSVCGRLVVPLGIHSVANATLHLYATTDVEELGTTDRAALEERLLALTHEMKELSHLPRLFQDAADRMVVKRLHSFGWADRDTIPLREYRDSCTAAGITRKTGWESLLKVADIPETIAASARHMLRSSD